MLSLAVAFAFVGLLAASSVWANRKYRAAAKLPMQWSLNGMVNWRAPRTLALSFTPLLAAVVLLGTATVLLSAKSDKGIGVLCVIGTAFVAAQFLHLRLIGKTERVHES